MNNIKSFRVLTNMIIPFYTRVLKVIQVKTVCSLSSIGMITIPAGTLAGTQIVQAAGAANTSTTNSGQGTVTVTLPVSGNMVNAGGMVMVRPPDEVSNKLKPSLSFVITGVRGVACSVNTQSPCFWTRLFTCKSIIKSKHRHPSDFTLKGKFTQMLFQTHMNFTFVLF